jgi:hypothetical protein
VEDRFVERKELIVGSALAQRCALLVDCEVHNQCEVVHNVQAVFETNLHVVLSGFGLHPAYIVDRI